jgi:hypothetical protein
MARQPIVKCPLRTRARIFWADGHDCNCAPRPLPRIEATLPEGSKAEARPDGKGGYLVTLPRGMIR